MSKKTYETIALVKALEVSSNQCVINLQPVKKYSMNQHFLCIERENSASLPLVENWLSETYTYKLLEKIRVGLKCKQQEFELLKTAAERTLPVHIQFKERKGKEKSNESESLSKYKLCKVRVEF